MPIRNHVPSSGNVFADLGLPKIDAISLRARRRQFLESIRPEFPRSSRASCTGFSIERLMRLLLLLGRNIEITVKERRSRDQLLLSGSPETVTSGCPRSQQPEIHLHQGGRYPGLAVCDSRDGTASGARPPWRAHPDPAPGLPHGDVFAPGRACPLRYAGPPCLGSSRGALRRCIRVRSSTAEPAG